MKSFLSIVTLSLGLCFLSPALAQSFNGFEMNTTSAQLQKTCTKKGGSWFVVPRRVLPEMPLRITSGAECRFQEQVVTTQEDGRDELVLPHVIMFTFDHVDLVEFMIFNYKFETWAARDHAMNSVRKNMSKLFPLTVKKLSADEYKLNNLPYYVTFLNHFIKEQVDAPFNFAVSLSREPFGVYTGEPPAEKPTLDDLNTSSNDPLENL